MCTKGLNTGNHSLYVGGMEETAKEAVLREMRRLLEQLIVPARAQPAEMVATLRALDACMEENRSILDPHLLHYLQKRSYLKAYEWFNADSRKEG